MKITHIILSSAFIFSCIKIQAQQNTVSAGGDISGSGGNISISIGQIDYSGSTGSSGNLSEGIQQPYIISVTTGITVNNIQLNFSVYPNPTISNVILSIDQLDVLGLSYQLFDAKGKIISENKLSGNITTIPMENFNASTYFIKVLKNNSELKTFKIIKN